MITISDAVSVYLVASAVRHHDGVLLGLALATLQQEHAADAEHRGTILGAAWMNAGGTPDDLTTLLAATGADWPAVEAQIQARLLAVCQGDAKGQEGDANGPAAG